MHIDGAHLALRRPIETVAPDTRVGMGLAEMPSIIGWWDASAPSGMSGVNGQPLSAWNEAVVSLIDKSGAGPDMTLYVADGTVPTAIATPRLSGFLGGVSRTIQDASLLTPALDPSLGFRVPSLTLDPAVGWSLHLVWSRPNRRQGSGRDADPVTLISRTGIPTLRISTDDRLLLSPSAASAELSFPIARRHTHSILMRLTPNIGLDVWLDDQQIVSSAALAATSAFTGDIVFLHDRTFRGGAQCWLHEAAIWNAPLSTAEAAAVLDHAARWRRGSRRGVMLVVSGQSNAINFCLNDGAAQLLAQGVAWHTGALAYNVLATTGRAGNYTMQGGHGIYATSSGYPGSFLQDPGDGSNPAFWPLGADGNALQAAIGEMSAEDRADIGAIVWPWNETDSLRNYSELPTFIGAMKRLASLERAMIGKPASALPLCLWNALPYGSDAGMQMHRKATRSIVDDPTQHAIVGNFQTADSNPRSSVWDATTGVATGGDWAHRDSIDNQRFARLAAPMLARAITADSISTISEVVPSKGGPRIAYAHLTGPDTLLLTIEHDCGTDLLVPRQAAAGKGFAVMEGGSATNPGPIVSALSCQRVDATHLRITLSRALAANAGSYGLYYAYGASAIGRGNCVTDNYASLPKLRAWDIGAELGGQWNLDFPLAATFEALSVNTTP